MIAPQYHRQADLLIRILPVIAREKDFALHGGSAINLFLLQMPRLSVDIDLTYLYSGERDEDLNRILEFLSRIREQLVRLIPGISVSTPGLVEDEYKLYCRLGTADVKIEVNTINRGVISPPDLLTLCSKASQLFNKTSEINVVSSGQLFGGKIVAALDRQHPRDLFDIRNMINTIGVTEDIMKGFIFCLLSSKRPLHEILNPSLLNQRATLNSQFSGMTDELFTYDEFEKTRLQLIKQIRIQLSKQTGEFLLMFADGTPDWMTLDYRNFAGIRRKLQNILKLKESNPSKHKFQLNKLKEILSNPEGVTA